MRTDDDQTPDTQRGMTPMPTRSPIDYTDLKVDPTATPRLADALSRFDQLKDDMDEKRREFEKAEAAYKEVREVILAEAYARDQSVTGWRLHFPALDRPLRMRWTLTNRFDRARLKAEKPEIEQYYSYDDGGWRLERQG